MSKWEFFFGMNFSIDPTFLYEKKMQEMLHKTFISTHFALLGRSVFYSIWICMNIGNCHNDILHNHIICHIWRCSPYHDIKRPMTLHFSAGHDLAHFKDNDLPRTNWSHSDICTSKCSTLTKPRFTAISMVVAVTVYILHLVGVTLFQKNTPQRGPSFTHQHGSYLPT